jgi:hypothetical protein
LIALGRKLGEVPDDAAFAKLRGSVNHISFSTVCVALLSE